MEHTVGPSTMRVALYGRVSTLDKGQDVNLQLNELRDYSERRGWKIAGEFGSGLFGYADAVVHVTASRFQVNISRVP